MHRSKHYIDLGIEIEENSELDLFEAFNQHEGDERIPAIIKEWKKNWVQEIKNQRFFPSLHSMN